MKPLTIITPGKDGDTLKNQDRAAYYAQGIVSTAVVCDGTTTSPESEKAAAYVVESALSIFEKCTGLPEIVKRLFEMRETLKSEPIKLSPTQEKSRGMFEDIVKDQRKVSYQTTLVAAQWTRDTQLKIKWVGCGDAALFVFSPNGSLLWSNLHLKNDSFGHTSPITEVLPDSYDEKKHRIEEKTFPRDAYILLCSDGLYDGFETFEELYTWIYGNLPSLESEITRETLLSTLHRKLQSKKGDDDISFVLDCPVPLPDLSQTLEQLKNDIQKLGEALRTTQNQYVEIRSEFSRDKGRIRAELEKLTSTVNAYEPKVRTLLESYKIDALRQHLVDQSSAIQDIEKRYHTIGAQIAHNTQETKDRFNRLEDKLATSQHMLDNLCERFDVLSQQLKTDLIGLYAELDNMAGALEAWRIAIDDLQQQLGPLRQKLETEQYITRNKFQELESILIGYVEAVNHLKKRCENENILTHTNLDILRGELTTILDELERMQESLHLLTERLQLGETAIRRELDIFGNTLAGCITEVQDIWKQINPLKRQVEDNTQMIDVEKARLDKLEARVTATEKRVGTLVEIERRLDVIARENKLIKVLLTICLILCVLLGTFVLLQEFLPQKAEVMRTPVSTTTVVKEVSPSESPMLTPTLDSSVILTPTIIVTSTPTSIN